MLTCIAHFIIKKKEKKECKQSKNIEAGPDGFERVRTAFSGPAHVNPSGPALVSSQAKLYRMAWTGPYGSYDNIYYFIGAIMERWHIFHVLFRASLVRCHWFCKVLTKELAHIANRLLPSLCAVRMTSIICMNHSASTFSFIQYPVLCSVEIQCTLRNIWIRVHCFVILVNVRNP